MNAVSERMRAARDVKATLGVGIALMIAAGAVTLTRSPPRVVRVGTRTLALRPLTQGDAEICQANEVLPSGVSAIRVALGAYFGSPVRVTAYSGSTVLTRGMRGPGWSGDSVTIPVTPLNVTAHHVKLCFDDGPNSELIYLGVTPTSGREAAVWRGKPIGDKVGVEYLASGQRSWWSRILSVARHIGVGHALSGTWVVLLISALVTAVGVLAVSLALRELP